MSRIKELRASFDKKLDALEHQALALEAQLTQFFPKGTRFTQLSRAKIKRVQVLLNDRPRKILNWHSPAHAFHHLLR